MKILLSALLGSGVMVTLVNHTLAQRRLQAERVREALLEVRGALRGLSRLIRQRGTIEIDGRELAGAFRDFEEAIRTRRAALGRDWRHLERSIRFAVGEDVGMPSWADLDWSDEVAEVSALDHRWWQYAVEYLEYVDDRFGEVVIGGRHPTKVELINYDAWLRLTGRYEGVSGVARTWPDASALPQV